MTDIAGERSATLQFLGATGTVTGSRYLLETAAGRLLVDCGLYQGLKRQRERNWQPFPVDPREIDALVVSHAHLDHTGYLPVLVRDGYGGRVHSTAYTAALTPLLLTDSAHIMTSDAEHANRYGYTKHQPARPLYTEADAERVTPRLDSHGFDARVEVGPAGVTFRRSGHILGSPSILVGGAAIPSVLFSGDLGRQHHPLLRAPAAPPGADFIVVESTYGDRVHPPLERTYEVIADAVTDTVRRGGSVLVPAFAVDRTEVVLHTLARLRDAGRIADVPVYVDSPLALSALAMYRKALAVGDPEFRPEMLANTANVFDLDRLHEAPTADESRRLNRPTEPCIIVSASGMATGGRVVHHLEHMLPDRRHTVLLSGHQADGSRGRALQDGARELKLHGRYVQVGAHVVTADGLSVHADQSELVAWLAQSPRAPQTVFVTHGEPAASAALRERISEELGWCVVVPTERERVRLVS